MTKKKMNEWPSATKVLTYALGLSDKDLLKLYTNIGKVMPEVRKRVTPAKATTR